MNKEAKKTNTTKPSVEELMRPRVIVENLWPGCQFEVGDILIKDGEYYWVIGDIGWYSKVHKSEIEPFPYLMRPLEWWEERTPEEMPEYVKLKIDIPFYGFKKGQVCPMGEIKSKKDSNINKYHITLLGKPLIDLNAIEPATRAEYLSHKEK
jgi:hypothetical protein